MYGGLEAIRSKRSPVTGANRSPTRTSMRSANPLRSTLRRAIAAASGERSVAMRRAAGSSFARASAIAPEPVHRSRTVHVAARSGRSFARDLDHRLGVGARHEHAGIDVQRQPPELVIAEQIGDRLAREAPLDQRAIAGELGLGERLIEAGIELHPRALQDVREQQLGLETRGADPRFGEALGRPIEHAERGPGRHAARIAPWRSAHLTRGRSGRRG